MVAPALDTTKIYQLFSNIRRGVNGDIVSSAGVSGSVTEGNFYGNEANSSIYAENIPGDSGNATCPVVVVQSNANPQATFPEWFGKLFDFADGESLSSIDMSGSRGVCCFSYASNLAPNIGGNPSWDRGGTQNTALVFTLISGSGTANNLQWSIWDGQSTYPRDLNTGVNIANISFNQGWRVGIIDVATTPTVAAEGTFDATDVTQARFQLSINDGTGGGSRNFIMDQLVFVESLAITDGDSGDPATFEQLLALSTGDPLYAYLGYQIINQFGWLCPIGIGDGANPSYFRSTNESIQFYSGDDPLVDNVSTLHILDNSLGIQINCVAGDDIFVSGTAFASGETRFYLRIGGSTSGTFIFNSCPFSVLGDIDLQGSAQFPGCSWSNCNRVNSGDNKQFTNNLFTNSPDTTGAFNWNGTQNIAGAVFSSNVAAINIPSGTTSVTLDNNDFSGNTYDFRVEGSGTLDIAVDVGSSTDHPGGFGDPGYIAAKVNAPGGRVVNITSPQPTVTFTNIPVTGCTLVLYNPDTNPDTQNAILTPSTLTEHDLIYTGASLSMRIQVVFPVGSFQQINLELDVADATIDVGGIAIPERNYNNPNLTP